MDVSHVGVPDGRRQAPLVRMYGAAGLALVANEPQLDPAKATANAISLSVAMAPRALASHGEKPHAASHVWKGSASVQPSGGAGVVCSTTGDGRKVRKLT